MTARERPRGFDREGALRQAMNVFWAKGYESTSMTELIDAMGIASPSLYSRVWEQGRSVPRSGIVVRRRAWARYMGVPGPGAWNHRRRTRLSRRDRPDV